MKKVFPKIFFCQKTIDKRKKACTPLWASYILCNSCLSCVTHTLDTQFPYNDRPRFTCLPAVRRQTMMVRNPLTLLFSVKKEGKQA